MEQGLKKKTPSFMRAPDIKTDIVLMKLEPGFIVRLDFIAILMVMSTVAFCHGNWNCSIYVVSAHCVVHRACNV